MTQELQDKFLLQAREMKLPVKIFLKNGLKLEGNIIGFDKFSVLVSRDSVSSLVYKHAIATLVPSFLFEDGD